MLLEDVIDIFSAEEDPTDARILYEMFNHETDIADNYDFDFWYRYNDYDDPRNDAGDVAKILQSFMGLGARFQLPAKKSGT